MPAVSDPKPSIFEALSAVMEDIGVVRKDARNTQQNYNFRGIDAVVNAAGPAFRKHKIVPVPKLRTIGYRDVQTSTGKPSREVTVEVAYVFYGPNGDSIEAIVPGESMDFGDKGSPKAMSVAYRIALLQVLCIPTDEAEPDSQSYERAANNGHPRPDEPRPEPSGRDWIAEAKALNDEEALLLLGRECNAFGEFKGEVKKALVARRTELAKPA